MITDLCVYSRLTFSNPPNVMKLSMRCLPLTHERMFKLVSFARWRCDGSNELRRYPSQSLRKTWQVHPFPIAVASLSGFVNGAFLFKCVCNVL